MPLNMGQMNELTKMLIQTGNDEGLSSKQLCETFKIDKDVILNGIESMRNLINQLIYITPYPDEVDDVFMVKIPTNEKWRAQIILQEGGWNKIFTEYDEKQKSLLEEEKRRLKLEEDSWLATKKIAAKANIISMISTAVALIALLLQLYSSCKTK